MQVRAGRRSLDRASFFRVADDRDLHNNQLSFFLFFGFFLRLSHQFGAGIVCRPYPRYNAVGHLTDNFEF